MPNSFFRFKHFTIHQDRCAMKVGTDGVLLGAWTNCSSAKHILDIGTGTGLLSLMLAQRQPIAEIEAIEIDPGAAQQARENVAQSPFADRITITNISLQDYTPAKQPDLIICNPPYFKVTYMAPDAKRNLARQAEQLSVAFLFDFASRYLAVNGHLSLIFPANEDIAGVAENYGFYPEQKTLVKGSPHLAPKRILWKFSRTTGIRAEDELIIESARHRYSDGFSALVRDFYL